mgnify:CR=1 FL=1
MKNKLLIKILIAAIVIYSASIYLPDIFWSTFKFKVNRSRISYSPIINEILITDPVNNVIKDRKGNIYTRDEYEAIMPQFSFAQLVFAGKMPDSIKGVAVDVPLLRKNLFQSTFAPYYIDGFGMILYPLLESNPGRVNLEYPYEFFVIKERMEIYNSKTNKLNKEMTADFTEALKESGFKFPAKKLFGNPTTRKAFDEGYFIIDNNNQFFHVKRVNNKPYCKKIELPVGIKVAHFNIHEIPLKEFYGFFVTETNELYLLTFNDYKLIKLNINDYNYKVSTLKISGDLFNRTVAVVNENKFNVFVFDRNYNLIDNYKGQVKSKEESTQGIIAAYLFPFSIKLVNDKSMFVNFFFSLSDYRFLVFNILLVLCTVLVLWLKKLPLGKNLFTIVVVLLAGIYGLIAILIIRDFNQYKSLEIRR